MGGRNTLCKQAFRLLSHSSGLAVGLGLGVLAEVAKKSLPRGSFQSGELVTVPGFGPWPGCVTWGKWLHPSEPQFPHVENGDDDNIPTSGGHCEGWEPCQGPDALRLFEKKNVSPPELSSDSEQEMKAENRSAGGAPGPAGME